MPLQYFWKICDEYLNKSPSTSRTQSLRLYFRLRILQNSPEGSYDHLDLEQSPALSELSSIYSNIDATRYFWMSTFPADLVDEVLTASYYFSLVSVVTLQHELEPVYSKAKDDQYFEWRMAAYNRWVEVLLKLFEQDWKASYDTAAMKHMTRLTGVISLTTFHDAEQRKRNQKQDKISRMWQVRIAMKERGIETDKDMDWLS